MNRRIQKFYNQAIGQAMESTGVEGIGGAYMELNHEKFAELFAEFIIDKCCKLQDARDILKYFGYD